MNSVGYLSPFFKFRRPVKTLAPHSAYELWARTYDQRENNALLQAEEQALIPVLGAIKFAGKTVADLGCGTGRHLQYFLKEGVQKLVGVDFSRQMLLAAKANCGNSACILSESSIEALPLRTGYFDVAISTLVLAHLQSLQRAVFEMSRVLKPQGTLVLSDFHPENVKRNWKRSFGTGQDTNAGHAFAAESYYHPVTEYLDEFRKNNLHVDRFIEPVIDETLEPLFKRGKASHIYRKFFGAPILIIYLLRKI